MKLTFRVNQLKNFSMPTWESIFTKYKGNPADIIAATGRTNVIVNTGGGIAYLGAAENVGRTAGTCR